MLESYFYFKLNQEIVELSFVIRTVIFYCEMFPSSDAYILFKKMNIRL